MEYDSTVEHELELVGFTPVVVRAEAVAKFEALDGQTLDPVASARDTGVTPKVGNVDARACNTVASNVAEHG